MYKKGKHFHKWVITNQSKMLSVINYTVITGPEISVWEVTSSCRECIIQTRCYKFSKHILKKYAVPDTIYYSATIEKVYIPLIKWIDDSNYSVQSFFVDYTNQYMHISLEEE